MLEFFQRHPEELREIQRVGGTRRVSLTKRPAVVGGEGRRAVKEGTIEIAEMFSRYK